MKYHDINNYHRDRYLIFLLIFGLGLMLLQIAIETIIKERLPVSTLTLTLISMAILVNYYFVKNIEKTTRYVAVELYLVTILMFINGSYIDTPLYIWAILSPVLIFHLLGHIKGSKWIASLVVLVGIFVLLVYFQVLPKVIDIYALIQTYLGLLSFSFIGYLIYKMKDTVDTFQNNEHFEKIQQLKKRMDLALSSYKAGVYEWNMEDNSVYLSPQWFLMVGYKEVITFTPELSTWKDRIHPDDKERVLREVEIALENKMIFIESTHRLKHETEGWIWILGRGKIQYNEAGNPCRMVGVHTDITEKVNIENQLRKANEEAKHLAQTKSIFLANMSHEIRTPLNAINGFIKLLLDEEKEPQKSKYLHIIDDASHLLLTTINDILDFSKFESGNIQIHKQNFKPYKEIEGVLALFLPRAKEKGITLEAQGLEKLPDVLCSDVLRIRQILNNLLSNAIKFTHVNGEITLTARYLENKLEILVQDNGIGIAPDKLDDIFNSFAQADDSTVRKYGGTGLGLAISKQFSLLLGGELGVESQEGVGSLFRVTIPMQEGTTTEKDEVSYNFDHPLSGHVLVAEDVLANQMFLEVILKGCGLSFDMANHGLEAVEKFKENHYDLILMDENMPYLNGVGATKAIRSIENERDTQAVPIIAITANALFGDREKFLESGMNEYLSKPIDSNQLKLILYKYLDR